MKQQPDHVLEYELARASGNQEVVARLFQTWREEIWRVTCFGTWFQGPLTNIREEQNGISFALAVEDGEVTLTLSAPFRRFYRTFRREEGEE